MVDDLSQDRHPASTVAMRDFWDKRARENAMWYVHSQLDFQDPDAAEFWRSGETVLDTSLEMFDLELEANQRVLEIGCGLGRVTRAMAARVRSVVGIDIAPEMIQRGQRALADRNPPTFDLGASWRQGAGGRAAGTRPAWMP